MVIPAEGMRVRLLEPMANPNSEWMPVEEGMPVGLEGTISHVEMDGPPKFRQIGVRWDNGRTIGLMVHLDRYEILQPTERVGNDS
jgi:hypothetical protein